ncbi:2-C-methyl-D-erythritol 4-phosphate cytidylyltransferase [Buchananella hordeovulneris]|uniref:2-C-methyl-D-erythritol 4-phosphate cytidylyltransferase n=1 Tax=Buchananella hordeovulneris TaxID=52770 RepID=A0A1Q5PTW4_9ACTO|nr:2-C-methyl-D-erythritol 4-phosphate cytidylyltransferase [Buchananella hordeovulneris]OKL50905.1 2-C-methyl-D-erythritol 4-phosphate cytidylyltransferase [Buchananella hordeovulneris]
MARLVVLTAAGLGTRLGAQGPKALVRVAGATLLSHALTNLFATSVDRAVVTAPAEFLPTFRAEVARGGWADRVAVVAGGHTRQASVAAGLAALAPQAEDVVLVHDAARALAPASLIARVLAAVEAGHDAVVPGLAVSDTIKEVAPGPSGGEVVVATPARAALRAVQTPQGFRARTLLAAHAAGAARAGREALAASDDAGLVEANGGTVVVVEGDARALKLTTPPDLTLFAYFGGTRQEA